MNGYDIVQWDPSTTEVEVSEGFSLLAWLEPSSWGWQAASKTVERFCREHLSDPHEEWVDPVVEALRVVLEKEKIEMLDAWYGQDDEYIYVVVRKEDLARAIAAVEAAYDTD